MATTCTKKKTILKIFLLLMKEQFLFDGLKLITKKTKVIALTHVSNATGMYTLLEPLLHRLIKWERMFLIDGASSGCF